MQKSKIDAAHREGKRGGGDRTYDAHGIFYDVISTCSSGMSGYGAISEGRAETESVILHVYFFVLQKCTHDVETL